MKQISGLLEALLERGVYPRISVASHRKALEEVADNLLKKYPKPKQLTDYSVIDRTTNEYLLNKSYNKRRGQEAARDIAEYRAKSAPKTRVFSQQELETVYKPWHQAHQTRGKSKELEELMDQIENEGEYIRTISPTYVGENDYLPDYVELLAAAHRGDGNALRNVTSNKSDKMARMKELYKAMYANKGKHGIDQLILLSKH